MERMQACTDVQFDAQVGAWCSEIERTKDYSNFPSLVSRASTQTSTNNKLSALVAFVVDEIETKQCGNATRALLLTLQLDPVPTRLLSKHYIRLQAYFEQRIDTCRDANAAKCFALLTSMLLKPDWPKTFDALAAMLQQTLQKKNLVGFQNCIVALVEFFRERRCAIQPGKLVLACRKAMDVNFDFSRSALCLMEDLVRRLGRGALAWANVLCEALEACFDEQALRLNAYSALTCFQENLGLAVCSKFAPMLASAVKQDWSSKNTTEQVLFAGLNSVSALYQSGACSVLPVTLRTDLDTMVFEAASAGGGALRNVKLRAAFLECLALACTTPTLEGDSPVLRIAVILFQRIASDPAEDTRAVKPSARRALSICAFRACSALPPVSHIVVSDSLAGQQFASSKPAAAAAQDSFAAAAARFTSNESVLPKEEEEPMTQPVTQEEITSSSSEEEEEEQPISNKRLQLMTPNAAATAAAESDEDSDDDDIPDIV